MRKLDEYTDREWQMVSSLPHLVGLAMSGIAASGVVGTTKEAMANSKAWRKAKEDYPNNKLIQAMMPDTENIDAAWDDAKNMRSEIMDKLKSNDVKDGEQLADLVMRDAHEAMEILDQKEDDTDVKEFKQWLLDIAHDVANAGTEGDILGFGGTQFSDKEKELYEEIKKALED